MQTLAAVLRNKRNERCTIDFDFKESQVIVDEKGHPTDVVIRDRQVGERLIEEFMLAANETIAEHFYWLDVPFVHRIHENPDEEKLEHFFEFLAGIGYQRSEEHTSELQSRGHLVCRLLLEKKNSTKKYNQSH